MRRAAVTPLLGLAAAFSATACRDTTAFTPQEPAEGPALATGQVTSTARWLTLTRAILGRREVGGPLRTARHFTLVAVAEYNAAVAAGAAAADAVAPGAVRPSEAAAAASAAAAVLTALYPAEAAAVAAQRADDQAYLARWEPGGDAALAAGASLGERAAAAVLARAANDRTDLAWAGPPRTGPGVWAGAPNVPPVAPRWGEARGWFLARGDQFRPAPPPAFGSAEYRTALAEVRAATDGRTPEQLQRAQFWQFGSGPAGPPGYLTEVALGLAADARLTERQTARVLALSGMAMMDATVACWDAKYAYWYLRPFEGDPAITTPVGRPNFPAYPSAHSCVTAAVSGVLAGFFPAAAPALEARVAEAGTSRIWAGLHFRFDVTAGRDIGRAVAGLALARVPGPRAPIPLE